MTAYELKESDYEVRILFWHWLQQNVHDRIMDPQVLFMTNQAQFTLMVTTICKINEYGVMKIFMPFKKCHYAV
jgi:hypothetical protein